MSDNKVTVKLRDKGSIFMDGDQTVTGSEPVELERTPRVAAAIRNGRLQEVKVKKSKTAPKEDPKKDAGKTDSGDNESGSEGSGGPEAVDYKSYKKDDLKKALDEKKIEYDPGATNKEMISLLVAHDKENSSE